MCLLTKTWKTDYRFNLINCTLPFEMLTSINTAFCSCRHSLFFLSIPLQNSSAFTPFFGIHWHPLEDDNTALARKGRQRKYTPHPLPKKGPKKKKRGVYNLWLPQQTISFIFFHQGSQKKEREGQGETLLKEWVRESEKRQSGIVEARQRSNTERERLWER